MSSMSSWLIAEIHGERKVLSSNARSPRTLRGAVTRQRRRGLRILAAYLRCGGPAALAERVYPAT